MVAARLCPCVRRVLARIVSRNFRSLFRRGHRSALLEMVTEKIEAPRLGGVHDSRLDRMQRQSGLRRPASHLFQRLLSFRLRVPHNTTKSSAYRTISMPFPAISWSSASR